MIPACQIVEYFALVRVLSMVSNTAAYKVADGTTVLDGERPVCFSCNLGGRRDHFHIGEAWY